MSELATSPDRIRLDTSVSEALAVAGVSLLPKDFQADRHVAWLQKMAGQRERPPRAEFRSETRERHIAWQLGLAIRFPLEKRLNYYYQTLYLIGRPVRIAEMALSTLADVTSGDTAESLLDSLSARLRDSETRVHVTTEELGRSLQTLLETAHFEHERVIALGRELFHYWRSDVADIRMHLDEARHALSEWGQREKHASEISLHRVLPLLSMLARPPELNEVLSRRGFERFVAESTEEHLHFSPILLVFLMALIDARSYDREGVDEMRDLEHYLYDLMRLIERQNIRPRVEAELQYLRSRYDERDPFEDYASSPPTKELRQEMLLNNLADGEDSPWLRRFKRSLDALPWWPDEPPTGDPADEGYILRLAGSADATVKSHLAADIRPAEDWPNFLLRLLKDKWLAPLVRAIRRAESTSWDEDMFASVMVAVGTRLAELGYASVDAEGMRTLWRGESET